MVVKSMTCLILNGKAAGREDLRDAIHTIRNEGHRIDIRVTNGPGDAPEIARQAAESGVPIVAAGGGDGTINQVVSGLLAARCNSEQPTALAVVPLGTANDLANSCGIPLDPTQGLRLAATGKAVAVDVARVNGRCFLNVATGGFGTQVTVQTPPELKATLGRAAYLLTALTRFGSIRPARGRVSGPGLDWEGEFLALAVGNGRQAGGGHRLCPDALLNDGLLDLRILPHLPAVEIHRDLQILLREGLQAVRRPLVSARLPALTIESDEPMQLNLDGEPIEGTRFSFEVLPGRLDMKLPPGCPLLE